MEIQRITEGLSSSAVYKIIVDGGSYVLKLGSTTDNYECMEIAARAGVAPPLYFLDVTHSVSISGFIEKKPFGVSDMFLTELARTIRAIHAMPLFPKQGSLFDTVESLIREVEGTPLIGLFGDLFEHYALVRQYYPWQDEHRVSSHNDLNPGNLIYDGARIWVIDWDAAFQNDRYVDLAIAANFFVHTEPQEKLFLETYFGDDLSDYHRARLFVMRQICRLVYAMLMFRLAYRGNASCVLEVDGAELQTANLRAVGEQLRSGTLSLGSWKGQLFYGKALVNAAAEAMGSVRFGQAISLISSPGEVVK
jgi:hypothetical protein